MSKKIVQILAAYKKVFSQSGQKISKDQFLNKQQFYKLWRRFKK